MEWIFIGIAIAVGFYIAPVVITFFVAVFLGILGLIIMVFEKFTNKSK